MSEIEFTSMLTNINALELPRFELQTRHRVRHRPTSWDQAWNELLSFALNNKGPDVSQVGSTWMGSLVGMQALRPFKPAELVRICSKEDYLRAAWDANELAGDPDVYAIPWITDTRLLMYRKDLLEKAGVDEAAAFTSHEAMLDTLQRLVAAGVEIPLAISTTDEALHYAAPWVWGAGGHFRTPDQRHLALTGKHTLTGFCQYFELHRYLAPAARGLSTDHVTRMFMNGQVAVALATHTLALNMVHDPFVQVDRQAVGAAPTPGIPFIGGSSLVVWKYSIQQETALDLIRFLLSPEAQTRIYSVTNELPVRLDIIESSAFSAHPLLRVIAQSLKTGRAFQSGYQWANIEKRLLVTLHQLWSDLFANPQLDLEFEVAHRLEDAAKRIERTILSV